MGFASLPRLSLPKRQDGGTGETSNVQYIVAGVVIAIVVVLIVLLAILTYLRKKRSIDRHRRLASTDDSELQPQQPETRNASTNPPSARRQSSNATSGAGLSNRLSVRSITSIITLPPYKETPGEAEEIIAREGEREGLDYIVEGPETAEELENRRQEEVAAIYRVQQTRRRELEERAERRRARRAALENQDLREVARLDRAAALARQRERNTSTSTVGQDSQSSAGNNSLSAVAEGLEPGSGELLAHLTEIRSRRGRVSSVTYAELGTQRHDGSRLRAASFESDSQPLLDSAGNMGRTSGDFRSTRSRASSVNSNNPNAHENGSNETIPGRERSRSRASRSGVDDTETISMQLSESGIPPEPPSYEDDLSVHGPDVPRYEDVILESRPQTGNGPDEHQSHPHAEVHEEGDDGFTDVDIERTPSRPARPSAVPLRLQTIGVPTPAIEVVSATPTHSRPATPLSSAGGATRPPTDGR